LIKKFGKQNNTNANKTGNLLDKKLDLEAIAAIGSKRKAKGKKEKTLSEQILSGSLY
jgi:hypothetical protein